DTSLEAPGAAAQPEGQQADRALALLTDRRVQDGRPVQLPVVAVGWVRGFDHRVDDHRPLFEEGPARQGHQRPALHEPARDLRYGDWLEPSAPQVAEDPAVVTEDFEGQSQPPPGFLEVWELAHAPTLGGPCCSSLSRGSSFPQQTLNLIGCLRVWRGGAA